MVLPIFKYHPNPISTGAIVQSDEECECCQQASGYIYTASFYTKEEVSFICPLCIADGSAAVKFEGMFSDDFFLLQAGVAEEVIDEVCDRTPGYHSWQQEQWQSHCSTACEFHGDASKKELAELSGIKLTQFLNENRFKLEQWQNMLSVYEEGGNPAIYKFKCTECSHIIYTLDFT